MIFNKYNLTRLALLSANLAAFPFSAQAIGFDGGSTWIISAGTAAGLNLQTGTPKTSVYSANVGIGHSLGEEFEVLLLGSYTSINTDLLPSNSLGEIDVQFNWVLMSDHANALYVGPKVGDRFANRLGVQSSAIVFGGALGKRFSIGGGMVSFSPEISALFVDQSGVVSTPAINIIPLQFTLFL